MTEINPILKNTSAYKIAENLDKQDGTADGKISKSIWNEFVKDKGGKEVQEFISIEDAMKSITTYAIRGAKAAKTTANELGEKWFKATPESGNADAADAADGADGAGAVGSADDKKNAPVNKGNADKDKAAAAKEQGLRPTYNSKFYYSETEKEHYKWNPKTKKFTKYSNIAYFNKDQTYVRKYKNKDGSAKVIDYSSDGYPTKMQAKNWQNKNYRNKDFAAKKLGLQPTYATKSEGIYYDKGTKMHYKWNEKTHAFDALNKNTRFVTRNGVEYGKGTKATITDYPNGTRKEVVKDGNGIAERIYNAKGKLQTKINKDKKGKLIIRYDHSYDNNGNPVKCIGKDSAGKIKETSYYKYQNGKLAKMETTNYENGKKSSVYHADANGKWVYQETYRDGVKIISVNYKYDTNGKDIGGTRQYFSNNGTIENIEDYELDDNGYETKTVYKDSSGNVDNIDYWTRRADGRAIAKKITDASGKTTEFIEYKYDAKGNNTKEIRKTPDGKITDVWEYKYDADGNIKEEIHKDGKGNVKKD